MVLNCKYKAWNDVNKKKNIWKKILKYIYIRLIPDHNFDDIFS